MKLSSHIGVFIATLLFALSFIWSKQALQYIEPITLVTGRVLIALTLVGGGAIIARKLQKLSKPDIFAFLILAAAEPVGYFLFETAGILLVTPTLACLIIGLIPLLSPLAAWIVNREKVTPRLWLALIIGFCGVITVALSDGADSIGGKILGILLLIGAVITSIIYTILVQRMSSRFNPFSIVAWQNVFAIIYLTPILFIFEYSSISNLTFSLSWFSPLITLGVLCSSIAFVLYANGIRTLGVTRTALYINLMPSMTAIASYFILNEQINLIKTFGIALAITALFIANSSTSSSSFVISEDAERF